MFQWNKTSTFLSHSFSLPPSSLLSALAIAQPEIPCLNSTMETPEKCVKSVNNKDTRTTSDRVKTLQDLIKCQANLDKTFFHQIIDRKEVFWNIFLPFCQHVGITRTNFQSRFHNIASVWYLLYLSDWWYHWIRHFTFHNRLSRFSKCLKRQLLLPKRLQDLS